MAPLHFTLVDFSLFLSILRFFLFLEGLQVFLFLFRIPCNICFLFSLLSSSKCVLSFLHDSPSIKSSWLHAPRRKLVFDWFHPLLFYLLFTLNPAARKNGFFPVF